ncbi:MAG: precorrin-6A reductase [Lachnospiraceae bacterium]|nr:precorrin-6A reductase [Lachnospiraceae bacterium]
MKVFIFGGTTEGRLAVEEYIKKGDEVTASVATEMGEEELHGLSAKILVGRLDEQGMKTVIDGYEVVIDATHPYAAEATRNIKKACADLGIAYQRIERDTGYSGSLPSNYFEVHSHGDAADYLKTVSGNILLTTGSKNLSDYSSLEPERLYARVLPTAEALSLCEVAGIPKSHIIAMHGPFSTELNVAMIRQYDIEHLVTKQTGTVGGFPEKALACIDTDTELVVVKNG